MGKNQPTVGPISFAANGQTNIEQIIQPLGHTDYIQTFANVGVSLKQSNG